jgi:TPR repeat protein
MAVIVNETIRRLVDQSLVCLIVVSVVVILALSMPAWANDVEDCRNAAALVETDAQRVVAACRRLAEQGDPSAQNSLGFLYANCQGIAQDFQEALRWYRLAADQGNAYGQANLGFMFDSGQGVPQNREEAAKWYRLAAEQGLATAQRNLGSM